jgi:hypothetical protein
MNITVTNLSPFNVPISHADGDGLAALINGGGVSTYGLNSATAVLVGVGDNPRIALALHDNRARILDDLALLVDEWHKQCEQAEHGTPAGSVHITVENHGPDPVLVLLGVETGGKTVAAGETYLAIAPGYVELREGV